MPEAAFADGSIPLPLAESPYIYRRAQRIPATAWGTAFSRPVWQLLAAGSLADRASLLKLKRPWPDGRTHLVLEPVAFLRRLVAIIPPPRRHLVRYAGVFGPASRARKQLRALVPDADPATTASPRCPAPGPPASSGRHRLPWADLLRRVLAQDVLACPCGGRRTVTAFVVDTTLARSVLTALGLVVEPTSFAPARDPPQVEFAWDDPA